MPLSLIPLPVVVLLAISACVAVGCVLFATSRMRAAGRAAGRLMELDRELEDSILGRLDGLDDEAQAKVRLALRERGSSPGRASPEIPQ